MIPKLFHRIWLGDQVPDKYEKYWHRFKSIHPDWEFQTWKEPTFQLHNQELYDAQTSPVTKSIILRYEILHRHGGIYVDCDVEPIKHFGIFTHASCFSASAKGGLSNAVMGCEEENGIMLNMIKGIKHQWAVDVIPDYDVPLRVGSLFWKSIVDFNAYFTKIGIDLITHDQLLDSSFAVHWMRDKYAPPPQTRSTKKKYKLRKIKRPKGKEMMKCAFKGVDGKNFVISCTRTSCDTNILTGEAGGYKASIVLDRSDGELGKIPQVNLRNPEGKPVFAANIKTLYSRHSNVIGEGEVRLQTLSRARAGTLSNGCVSCRGGN